MAPERLPQTFKSALSLSLTSMIGFVVMPVAIIISFVLMPWISVPLLIAYYTRVYFNRTVQIGLGAPWPWLREHYWAMDSLRRFFRFKVHLPEELSNPDKMEDNAQFVLCCHPHGVNSEFRVLLDGLLVGENRLLPKVKEWRALAASVLFTLPLVRELVLWSGCIDAGRESANKCLDAGYSLIIVPGGEHEQMLTRYGHESVYLKKRKGFVRLALKHKTGLIPAYVFGCVDTFRTYTFLSGLRMWLMKNYYVAIPLFAGEYYLPGAAFKVPLNVVFGPPIVMPEMPELAEGEMPDPALVDKVHAQYIVALKKVFDDNKAKFGCADRELEIL